MKTKTCKNILTAGALALVAVYATQASALPLKTFSFHQLTGFLVDDSPLTPTTANVSGGGVPAGEAEAIQWFGAVADDGNFTAPASTYQSLGWGREITDNPTNEGTDPPATLRGLTTDDPFANGGTGNSATARSSVKVEGFTGNVTTGAALGTGSDWGSWVDISRIQHANRTLLNTDTGASPPITTEVQQLTSAIIRANLHFDEQTVNGGTTPIATDSDSDVSISFTETLNTAIGSCETPIPPGGYQSGCDDRFGFSLADFAPIQFMFDGHTYEVQFNLELVQFASTDFPNCDTIAGVCSLWTQEGQTSIADVQMRIRQLATPDNGNELPEPTTLFLIGGGLLGLGMVRRRRSVSVS